MVFTSIPTNLQIKLSAEQPREVPSKNRQTTPPPGPPPPPGPRGKGLQGEPILRGRRASAAPQRGRDGVSQPLTKDSVLGSEDIISFPSSSTMSRARDLRTFLMGLRLSWGVGRGEEGGSQGWAGDPSGPR